MNFTPRRLLSVPKGFFISLGFCMFLAGAAFLPLALTSCTQPAARIEYNTLWSTWQTTDNAVKAYLDQVVAGRVPTNGVPKVQHAYTDFQAGFLLAVSAASFNTNAAPPASLIESSVNVLTTIFQAKGTP